MASSQPDLCPISDPSDIALQGEKAPIESGTGRGNNRGTILAGVKGYGILGGGEAVKPASELSSPGLETKLTRSPLFHNGAFTPVGCQGFQMGGDDTLHRLGRA